MLELAVPVAAGLAVTAAGFLVAQPQGLHPPRAIARWSKLEDERARQTAWPWLDGPRSIGLQALAGAGLAAFGDFATGLPALAIAGVVAGTYAVRQLIAQRSAQRQAVRQDAVIEAVRMMRQLLETGATTVNQAVALLAERGPLPLRAEFRFIAARSVGRRQAWRESRERIGEPLFDMLAAAVLIQRPGGGELAPLFADLEASVSAALEVEREARALQAQARSASSIIVTLPPLFLVILSALRSPYMDAFHQPPGQVFLLLMLAVMAAGYAWMRRVLELPGLQRVRLTDA